MILPAHTPLYRYDLKEPPKEWSTSFHEYKYEGWGNKNIIGAFFFYDNIENCQSTCANEANYQGTYYLTKCETAREANLLCLCFEKMIRLLDVLYHEGIDVFNSEMCTFSTGDARPLSNKSEEFERYIKLVDKEQKSDKDCMKLLSLVNDITQYIEPSRGNANFRYMGQLLTDFMNGPIFKRYLSENGYEGYVFFEHDEGTPCVKTYCFFDQTLLSTPSCEKITSK